MKWILILAVFNTDDGGVDVTHMGIKTEKTCIAIGDAAVAAFKRENALRTFAYARYICVKRSPVS